MPSQEPSLPSTLPLAAPSTLGPADAPLRRGRLTIALALLCLALGLRLVGIDHGLPHNGEPDAYLVQQGESMIADGITDRHFAGWKYPHLMGTILALAPPEKIERLGPGATLAEHLELSTRLRQRGRVVVAVVSSLAAPATYLIAARFLGARFAFLAGLLVASSLLHICFSVQARPHGPVSAFVTLALLAAIRWREKPTYGRALVLGLSVAASLSTLHSGASALAPAGAALLGLLRGAHPKGRVLLGSLLALTIVAVSAGWFYVRAEDGYGRSRARYAEAAAKRNDAARTGKVQEKVFGSDRVIRFSGHVVSLSRFNGNGFGIALKTLRTYDPVVLFFAALGLLGSAALSLRRRKSAASGPAKSAVWITLAYGVPTFFMYGIYQYSMDRFYLALTPVTCILAAYGMSWLWARKIPRAIPGALITVGVASMLIAAALVARLRVVPDTYTLAAEAIEEASGSADPLVYTAEIVGLPLMSQPELLSKDAIWSRGPWDRYQWAVLHPETLKVQGEVPNADLTRAAAPREAALRLGRRIVNAPSSTRLAIFRAEDRAATAAETLREVNPDIVVISTSKARGYSKIGPASMRDAWKDGVRSDGSWQLERTIRNSTLDDRDFLGYTLSFMGAFTSSALGPEIEVWTRR